MKVFLITNIPSPYRIPLFNEIDRRLGEEGRDLEVIFAARSYGRRKWMVDLSECTFPYRILPSRHVSGRDDERVSFTYPGLWKIHRREKPLTTIVSGFSPATTKLWLRSLLIPTPYIIWSGAVESPHRPVSFLRRLQRRAVVSRARAFVAYGTRAKRYLIGLGAEEGRVHIAVNTVDTGFFSAVAAEERRRGGGGEGRRRLIYVGHLTAGKRVDRLLEVVRLLGERRQDFFLEIVGDGPERSRLEGICRQVGIESLVVFAGFLQKEEVARRLARADCFVFPSEYDIWGLVLVEAMAAGLPCLASVEAGATDDLIVDGETGFAVDFADGPAVAARVGSILDDPAAALRVGREAACFVAEKANLAASAEGFLQALHYAESLK